MDEKQLEQEYRKQKTQSAPDLWDRIEKNLKDHPEREKEEKKVLRLRPYGFAAAAAAVLVLAVSVPLLKTADRSGGMEGTTAAAAEAAEGAEKAEAAGAADGYATESYAAETAAAPQAKPDRAETEAAVSIMEEKPDFDRAESGSSLDLAGTYQLEEEADQDTQQAGFLLTVTRAEDNKIWGNVDTGNWTVMPDAAGRMDGVEITDGSFTVCVTDQDRSLWLRCLISEQDGNPVFLIERMAQDGAWISGGKAVRKGS